MVIWKKLSSFYSSGVLWSMTQGVRYQWFSKAFFVSGSNKPEPVKQRSDQICDEKSSYISKSQQSSDGCRTKKFQLQSEEVIGRSNILMGSQVILWSLWRWLCALALEELFSMILNWWLQTGVY